MCCQTYRSPLKFAKCLISSQCHKICRQFNLGSYNINLSYAWRLDTTRSHSKWKFMGDEVKYSIMDGNSLFILSHGIHDIHDLSKSSREWLKVSDDSLIITHCHTVCVSCHRARFLTGRISRSGSCTGGLLTIQTNKNRIEDWYSKAERLNKYALVKGRHNNMYVICQRRCQVGKARHYR